MPESYNTIAGTSVERLAAISDGVFAVAMTLLVLDIHTPATELIHGELDLLRSLRLLLPRLLVYVMSFLTLGIFWIGQQTQLNLLERSSRNLSWIHIAFLFAVSITPFSTQLLAQFLTFRTALLAYWLNIFLLGTILFLSWRSAIGSGVVKKDIQPSVPNAVQRRILGAQALYAIGAGLCVVNTYLSVAVIIALQLNYAIAPRSFWKEFRREKRLS
ncbi:TMEM175 family protein [Tunturiibacter lichenicola]|uniref:TMEM175 family protein n=1 Tax=Tunturiibacter lichenicola TaxID=2051959 RepID=UPI0021B2A52B|nr:TMEM175 family protein [Edaphobacter lichenicola]